MITAPWRISLCWINRDRFSVWVPSFFIDLGYIYIAATDQHMPGDLSLN